MSPIGSAPTSPLLPICFTAAIPPSAFAVNCCSGKCDSHHPALAPTPCQRGLLSPTDRTLSLPPRRRTPHLAVPRVSLYGAGIRVGRPSCKGGRNAGAGGSLPATATKSGGASHRLPSPQAAGRWGAVPSVEIRSAAYLIDDFHLCLGKARATQQSAGEVGADGGGRRALSGTASEGGARGGGEGRRRAVVGRAEVTPSAPGTRNREPPPLHWQRRARVRRGVASPRMFGPQSVRSGTPAVPALICIAAPGGWGRRALAGGRRPGRPLPRGAGM